MSPLLSATRSPEERGLRRDEVRLMVARRNGGRIVHSQFLDLPRFLGPEDIVVINTSATLPAAVDATDEATGEPWVLHFSTALGAGLGAGAGGRTRAGESESWVVEPRLPHGRATKPLTEPGRPPVVAPPARLAAPGRSGEPSARVRITGPYRGSSRLFVATVQVPGPVADWLMDNGRPIRYSYVESVPGIESYQNVYALEPGSAEMPSAGRPFSAEVLTRLVAQGTAVAPVVLHTGVSSLESGELPYPERVRVSPSTCRRVNDVRRNGGRVVAVGTTVVRALESAVDPASGLLAPIDGWTDLVVRPDHRLKAADGLITGWHEAQATHRWIIEAFAGRPLLDAAYEAAAERGYLLHEFGDAALFLP